MNPKIKDLLRIIAIPVTLLAVYLVMYLLWKAFGLPSDDQLLVIVKDWFARYGLWIVFVGALIEGFLLLGQYFPGGFIIFLGVISAGKNIPRAVEVVSIVSIAFFIAYTLNYLLGKYGWYRLLVRFGLGRQLESSKDKLVRKGLSVIFFSYWEPNLASITATAAGVLKIPLRTFSIYSAGGIIFWNVFWGTLVYLLGDAAMQIVGLKWVLVIFAVWLALLLFKKYVWDRKFSTSAVGKENLISVRDEGLEPPTFPV